MLDFLRRKAQSFVIQAIVVIIALVFIFWGVGTNLMNQQEAAIVVNGEEISFQTFQQVYEQTYDRLASQFGGTIPKELADTLDVRQQVISQLVQEALLRQGGAEMGLMVSGGEVQNEIAEMVQFQENGRFNQERYNQILAANRLSPGKYEDSLRYEMLANKTVAAIADFAVVASDREIEELYALEKETVSVSYVVFSPSSYQDTIEIDEEELASWYEDNAQQYKTEPQVKLTYLPFTYADIGEKIGIDDEAVRDYYDNNLTQYQRPEQRHARHILFKADPDASQDVHRKQRQKAETVLAKARGGEDFSALAEEYSEGPTAATGGDLGFFAKGQMVKPFEDAVFSMQVGDVSDIVTTDFGYHIIKLEDIKLAGVTPFAEVQEKIAAELALEQAKPMAWQLANAAYEGIIGAGSLTAYLEENPDTEVVSTDFFSRSEPPAGLAADPAFLERAFSLQEGELSSIIEVSGGYVIISATALRQPQVRQLEEVRDRVVSDFRAQKAAEAARSAAQQLISDTAAAPESFTSVAAERGLTVRDSGQLHKGAAEHQSDFPQNLVPSAFRLTGSEPVVEEPEMSGQDYYVFALEARLPPQEPMTESERDRYRDLLLQYKQNMVLDAWVEYQQAAAEVSIHRSLQNQ